MNRFLTPLDVRKVGYDRKGRPIWELLADLIYESDKYGLIVVPKGFCTNFASVPRLPVFFLVAGDMAHEMACVHDYLYTVHMIEGRAITRADADAIFLEAMGAPTFIKQPYDKKVPELLAKLMYQAVHLAGQSSWDADTLVPQPQHVQDEILAGELVAP
jgi:hypothetical protein